MYLKIFKNTSTITSNIDNALKPASPIILKDYTPQYYNAVTYLSYPTES